VLDLWLTGARRVASVIGVAVCITSLSVIFVRYLGWHGTVRLRGSLRASTRQNYRGLQNTNNTIPSVWTCNNTLALVFLLILKITPKWGKNLKTKGLEPFSNRLARPWLFEKTPVECVAWIPFAAGCNIRVTHHILHQGVLALDIPDERSQHLVLDDLEGLVL
jgi:hypothetical protein